MEHLVSCTLLQTKYLVIGCKFMPDSKEQILIITSWGSNDPPACGWVGHLKGKLKYTL